MESNDKKIILKVQFTDNEEFSNELPGGAEDAGEFLNNFLQIVHNKKGIISFYDGEVKRDFSELKSINFEFQGWC